MRSIQLSFVLVSLVAACGGDGGSSSPDASDPGETPAFTVVSKDVTLQPGEEVTYCYYFHTGNSAEVAIKKWTSEMGPISHHMIMFFGAAGQPADGTLTTDECGVGGGSLSVPVWVYASQTPHGELALPVDDGAGKPLGMNVPANQPAYFQMHYLNATEAPVTGHVTLNAYAYDASTAYTPTAAFITYDSSISIPGNSTDYVSPAFDCNVPAGATFWTVSTHAHKQAVKTEIRDGATPVFTATDWEHPGAKSWDAPTFYKFASGKLTYECTYTNPTANPIVDGPSAQTNEMCMGTGYFFPATAAKFCINNQGPF